MSSVSMEEKCSNRSHEVKQRAGGPVPVVKNESGVGTGWSGETTQRRNLVSTERAGEKEEGWEMVPV